MTTERAAVYRSLVEQTLFNADFFAVRGRQGDKAIANRFYNLIPLIADLKKADRAEENDMTTIDCGGCAPPVQVTIPNDAARPVAYPVAYAQIDNSGNLWRINIGKPTIHCDVALYTAADYDALREERDRIARMVDAVLADNAKFFASMEGAHREQHKLRLRAEAAEAKVARVVALTDAWDDLSKSLGFSGDKSALDIRAALNEGDGE